MSDMLVDELTQIVPDLMNMTTALGVPELGVALHLAEMLYKAIESELHTRTVTVAQAKASIDSAFKASLDARFPK